MSIRGMFACTAVVLVCMFAGFHIRDMVKGDPIADIKSVESHVQALGQCRRTIRKLGIKPIVAGDTARVLGIVFDRLYVVRRGAVQLVSRGGLTEVVRAPGWFGEMSILDVQPRSASAPEIFGRSAAESRPSGVE